MTLQILIVLSILVLAIVLFITEKIRVDIVALIVLVSLTLSGLITPSEALSGFSNPAVVTVWAVLILSSALSRTGVASIIGRPVLRLGGGSEARLIAMIMLLVGVLSGFMNDYRCGSLDAACGGGYRPAHRAASFQAFNAAGLCGAAGRFEYFDWNAAEYPGQRNPASVWR